MTLVEDYNLGMSVRINRERIVFSIVILILVLNAFIWGSQKEGFHGDELYSYHFICNVQYPGINSDRENEKYLNNWHDSQYYRDYFIISEEERFNIKGVFDSIKQDVHPPVFYILLDIIVSLFFPNRFSKWSGILLNMLFYLLTLTILYLFSKKMLRSEKWALTTTALYGISSGAVSTIVFIRMYMVLTAVSVLTFYLHFLLWEKVFEIEDNSLSRRKSIMLMIEIGVSVVLGILTHYYYLIFIFFISLFMVLWFLMNGKIRMMFTYAGWILTSVLVSLIIWPDIIWDLVGGYRGTEAIDNMKNANGWNDSIIEFIKVAYNQVFGISVKYIFAIIVLLVLISIMNMLFRIKCIKKKDCIVFIFERKEKKETLEIKIDYRYIVELHIIFVILFTFIIVSIIAPFKTNRYIFNILPLVFIVIAFILKEYIDMTGLGNSTYFCIIVGVVSLLIVLATHGSNAENNLYKKDKESRRVIQAYNTCPCVMVTDHNRRYFSCTSSIYLMDLQNTFVVNADEIDELVNAFPRGYPEQILCFVDKQLDVDSIVSDIEEQTGYKKHNKITDASGMPVYIFGR